MSGERAPEPIAIVKYADEHADAFARLNREWLERYALLEDGDLEHLYCPRESILAGGGEIFLAMAGGEVVGTCAAIVCDRETIELAKLSVAEGMRGRGIGRTLTEAVLAWARERSVRKVTLVSSTKLKTALRLYERLGFAYVPLPANPGYATADIYMELAL